MPEVFLLTDDSGGRVAIPHLQVNFVATGIELDPGDGELAWRCNWEELEQLFTAERSIHPDGREGVVVVVVEKSGHRHRFVIPTDDAGRSESRIRALAVAHGVSHSEGSPAASKILTAAVIIATVATVVVLLLSAAHVIHF